MRTRETIGFPGADADDDEHEEKAVGIRVRASKSWHHVWGGLALSHVEPPQATPMRTTCISSQPLVC